MCTICNPDEVLRIPAVVECRTLVEGTGGVFELGHFHVTPDWYARATWPTRGVVVEDHAGPEEAARALLETLKGPTRSSDRRGNPSPPGELPG